MATGDSQTANFSSWLNQATDPNNQEDRWESIQGFYQLVNQEADGPQIAVRLLAHKIQSPQEKEALQALTVLEACMNNCGKRFHSEAAKFRFLNELIKVLTPKYFGAWTPQKVKDRVTEVLYGWTLWLKDEPKIQEAYSMLKTQGIITKDPEAPDTLIMAPPPQRTTDSVFDQEEKAKLLARLLKSGRPEDLETANRLIKSTIKEEQEKAEKAARRESTLKQVESSTKQLRAAMEQHADAATPLQPSDDLKALYEGCERLRPSLFRLASDTVDDDAALAQILAANDDLTLAVNAYKERLAPGGRRHANNNHAPSSPIKSYHLIDLSALESTQSGQPAAAAADSPPPPPSATSLLCDLESSFLGVAEQEEPMEHTGRDSGAVKVVLRGADAAEWRYRVRREGRRAQGQRMSTKLQRDQHVVAESPQRLAAAARRERLPATLAQRHLRSHGDHQTQSAGAHHSLRPRRRVRFAPLRRGPAPRPALRRRGGPLHRQHLGPSRRPLPVPGRCPKDDVGETPAGVGDLPAAIQPSAASTCHLPSAAAGQSTDASGAPPLQADADARTPARDGERRDQQLPRLERFDQPLRIRKKTPTSFL